MGLLKGDKENKSDRLGLTWRDGYEFAKGFYLFLLVVLPLLLLAIGCAVGIFLTVTT